jgi:hypothetical protein
MSRAPKTGQFDDFVVQTGSDAAAINGLPRLTQWPQLAPDALIGLAGQLVAVIGPFSEGDPVSTLLHTLVGFGNLIGPVPHVLVQHDRHPAKEYVALVGTTGKSRKGLSWSTPRHVLSSLDPVWGAHQIKSGLSSGEGVIYAVRDARHEAQPIREKGNVIGYEDVCTDHGTVDKRLLVVEPEFGGALRRMSGDGNTLSHVLREGWDDLPLHTLTRGASRSAPLRAGRSHISVIGHVTGEELRQNITEIDVPWLIEAKCSPMGPRSLRRP